MSETLNTIKICKDCGNDGSNTMVCDVCMPLRDSIGGSTHTPFPMKTANQRRIRHNTRAEVDKEGLREAINQARSIK